VAIGRPVAVSGLRVVRAWVVLASTRSANSA
jgi:hypothetical protein